MPTSNKEINDMLRGRRKEMSDLPAYEGPPSDDEAEVSVTATASREPPPSEPDGGGEGEESSGITVMAPGDPSDNTEGFEYEPMTDIPGAWVVYPPGVPCDDTEYRIALKKPAGAGDFAKMQKALEDAGGWESAISSSGPVEDVEAGVY